MVVAFGGPQWTATRIATDRPQTNATAESGAQCGNFADDDGDTFVDDGCDTMRWLLADHLGGTVEVLDANGVTVQEQKFWPYGSARSGSLTNTDKQFTGQQKEIADPTLGLYNYDARFYSTTLGRFLSADSYTVNGFNRYAYVGNNPLRWTDPTGHMYPAEGGSCDTACGWREAWHAYHPGEKWGSPAPPSTAPAPVSLSDAGSGTDTYRSPCWFCLPTPELDPPVDWEVIQHSTVAGLDAIGETLTWPARTGWEWLYNTTDESDQSGTDPNAPQPVPAPAPSKTDNNGNPLPQDALKLKGGRGYRLKNGNTYIPNRAGNRESHHGEHGHEVNRRGQYRNVTCCDQNGQPMPVEGAAGEWH